MGPGASGGGRDLTRSEDVPSGRDAPWRELDLLKAVAILAVVAIHTKRSWLDGQASGFELALDPLLRFAVPAFVFAAGALAAGRAGREGFLTRRLLRLLPPYLVASIAAWLFRFAHGEALGVRRIAFELVTASAFGPYYYVFALTPLLLVAPLLVRGGRWIVPALLPALLLAQWWSEVWAPDRLPFFWHLRSPLLWAAYFVAGWGYASFREPLRRLFARPVAVPAAAVPWALVLAVVVARGGLPAAGRGEIWLLIWTELVFLLALGVGVGRVLGSKLRWALALASASYTIYLWHLFAVEPLRDALRPEPGVVSWLFLVVPWLAGIALPLVLLAFVRRVAGPAVARTWFGG